MPRLLFHADPHGDFAPLRADIERESPDAVILLGDYELDRPLEEMLDGVDVPLYWIHGNHDIEEDAYDFLFDSVHPALDGRVVPMAGLRVAGLGGVFKQKVWYPGRGEPIHASREERLAATGKGSRWRGGLPRRLRDAIWPAEWEALSNQSADILVLHEAPESHPNGFRVLGELARAMGVHTVLHGHHHHDYEAQIEGGITVIGLGEAGSRLLDPAARGTTT
ncbi:MAG: metallophosphoesterase family protein [Pseudomonadota bacterium]